MGSVLARPFRLERWPLHGTVGVQRCPESLRTRENLKSS